MAVRSRARDRERGSTFEIEDIEHTYTLILIPVKKMRAPMVDLEFRCLVHILYSVETTDVTFNGA